MPVTAAPYDTAFVQALRAGSNDAYGCPPERKISDGTGNPCRHCLAMIPKGAPMLVAAACPFPAKQPYAETGPVFFCAEDCAPYDGDGMPPCVADGENRLLKGYTHDHRIFYGSGTIVAVDKIAATCEDLFRNPNIAFVDVRSALNNCFTFRVTRADDPPLR